MPIVIGAKPESNFKDPIGLLHDCHRRIERFLRVLVTVTAEAHGGQLSGEQRTALDTALRYFREAAPKHTADEEDSLFPRLRALGQLEKVAEHLEDDHERADRAHAEADRLGQEWLAAGTLSAADAARLSAVMAELAELYQRHIAVEEGEVFPLASRVLTAGDREAIGGEMAARRGLAGAPSLTSNAG